MQLHQDEYIQAFVYFSRNGDQNNMINLTNQRLVVIRNGKANEYDRSRLKDVSVQHRKMLGGIVLGGIAICLSLIAIFTNQFNYQPILLLMILFLGTLAFYYGYDGARVLSIQEDSLVHDFSLPVISENMQAFITFTQDLIKKENARSNDTTDARYFYYVPMALTHWENQKDNAYLQPEAYHKNGYFIGVPKEQFKKVFHIQEPHHQVILQIDSIQLKAPVKYELDVSTELVLPHIYGPVNREAIVDILNPTSLEH